MKNIRPNEEITKEGNKYRFTGNGSEAKYELISKDPNSGDQTCHIIRCTEGLFEGNEIEIAINGELEWNEFCEFIKEVSEL